MTFDFDGTVVRIPAGVNLNNAQNLQNFLTNRNEFTFGTRYAVVEELDVAFSRIGGRDNRWVALLEGLKSNKPAGEFPAPTPEINEKIDFRLESGMTDLAQWIGAHPELIDQAWSLVMGGLAVIEVPRLSRVDDEALVRIDQELTGLVRAKNHVFSGHLKELLESLFAMKPGDPLVHHCILHILTLMQQKSPWLIWGYQREMTNRLPQLIRRVWSRVDHDTRLELITRLAHLQVKGFFGLDHRGLLYLWQDILRGTPQYPIAEIAGVAIDLAHYDAGFGEGNHFEMSRDTFDLCGSCIEPIMRGLDIVLHPRESLKNSKGFWEKAAVLTSPVWFTAYTALMTVFIPVLAGYGTGTFLLGFRKRDILRRELREVVERLHLPSSEHPQLPYRTNR